MELKFTKSQQWLDKWDLFVSTNDVSSHLLLSDWIESFSSYGFGSDYCIAEENGIVIGGYAAVIAKAGPLKFYIVPFGPIVSKDSYNHLDTIVASAVVQAQRHGACYCHVTLPVSTIANAHVIPDFRLISILKHARNGHAFKYVYSSSGLNWISLDGLSTEEAILDNFKSSVRRDVRSSLRKGLVSGFAESQSEIESAYALCAANAQQNGYSVRSWEDFKETITGLIAGGNAKFVIAKKDGELKASAFLVKAGNYWTYVIGGTLREKPDLLAGHFVHWQAISQTLIDGFDGYNISLGGSAGVLEFKNGFGTEQITFEAGKYHWILKPIQFRLFLFADKKLRRYKPAIAKLLSKLRR